MTTYHLHANLSMRDAIRIARELGCTVHLDEEHVIDHESWPKRMCMHVGKRDAGLVLLSKLRQLAKRQGHRVTT